MTHRIPVGFSDREDGLHMHWIIADRTEFRDPVFGMTCHRLVEQVLKGSILTESEGEEFQKLAHKHPEFSPSGIIYHVSRCGSTLLANMLSSVDQHFVLSEPTVPLIVLARHLENMSGGDASATDEVRASFAAFYQPQSEDIHHYFFKLFSGNIFQIPVIRNAFPGVREIFLYRDPVEVIVSNVRGPIQNWLWTDAIIGLPRLEAMELSIVELAARAIGRKMAAMRRYYDERTTLLMNYSEIGPSTPVTLLSCFGLPMSEGSLERMMAKLAIYAKDPEQKKKYQDDRSLKKSLATDALREVAMRFAYPDYYELEKLRNAVSRSR
jgi:hypothetical protein